MFGDHGRIDQSAGTLRITTTGNVTAVLTVGARVAWDNTAKNINVPGTGRFPVGIATEAAGNGITSVAVRLDGVGTVAA